MHTGYLVRRVCACLKISQVRFAINVRAERAKKNAKIEQFHQELKTKDTDRHRDTQRMLASIPSNWGALRKTF